MRRPLSHPRHVRSLNPARWRRAGWAGVLAALLVLSCGEPPGTASGEHERQPGVGCGDLHSECLDAETLWACVERRWDLIDCAQECATRGGLVGCLAGPELSGGGARCWCEEDAPECGPGQAKCVSDEAVQVCDPETLSFVESSCETLCMALEPPHLAAGCSFGTCKCTLEGTPCAPESPARCEPFALAQCVDGIWHIQSCPCSPGDCDPWAPGGAACDC